jgi:hypothetical protein
VGEVNHDSLVVDIAQLRRALAIGIDELQRTSGSVMRLEKDFFWAIPREERFNPYEQPETMTVGQLSELIGHVSALDSDPGRVTRQHLVWLGELLKAIGELPSD